MMRALSRDEVIENAKKYRLRPVKIKGRDVIQLSKNRGERFVDITWEEFFETLEKKHLAVYISKSGYMKIMSDDVYD